MPLARLPVRRRLEMVVRCPGCDLGPARDLRVVVLDDSHEACRLGPFDAGDVVAFRLCSTCGLVSLSPRPAEETLAVYYRDICLLNEAHTSRARASSRTSAPSTGGASCRFWSEARERSP